MQETSILNNNALEVLKKTTAKGGEYWLGRDIQQILGYDTWEYFENVIDKAKLACTWNPLDHFRDTTKMVEVGSGAKRKVKDYFLSRHACYLIAMNGDPSKPEIALAQTYFSQQTIRQEQRDKRQFSELSEEERRLELRSNVSEYNKQLASTAKNSGVITPLDFAVFQDHGYKGLYGGLKQKDIHKKRNLKKSQKILDHMGSTELAANQFRITQTEEKLRHHPTKDKNTANKTHKEVGEKVRKAIRDIGGIMPEELPTVPSIKQIDNKSTKKLEKQ